MARLPKWKRRGKKRGFQHNAPTSPPQSYRRIVDWFQRDWIKYGDSDRPSRLFTSTDPFSHAVVLDNALKYQEPREEVATNA